MDLGRNMSLLALTHNLMKMTVDELSCMLFELVSVSIHTEHSKKKSTMTVA
jgi:hypothetical protein